ncbi:hypothetical protein HFZ78_22700 [Priestia megaterium]|uniref:Uncharacterized protein n=1 Tax=Priestia megaterium TaxID=1404 RepID=A0A6H1NVN3_PRIMG|nr:hypothetical protein HFZ78_22700 [Priestia megaterium]
MFLVLFGVAPPCPSTKRGKHTLSKFRHTKADFSYAIAAVTVVGPKNEIYEYSISEIVQSVCDYTNQVSAELGRKTPDGALKAGSEYALDS